MRHKTKDVVIKRQENVSSKEVEGELLLLNLKDGNYYGLNPTGMFIWHLLDAPKTTSEIVKALKRRFNLKEETLKRHLSDFLRDLSKHHLIKLLSSKR